MFDKEEYRTRRKAGLRGQGDKPPKYGDSLMEAMNPTNSEYIFDGENTSRRTPKLVGSRARVKHSKRARKELALNEQRSTQTD